MISESVKQKLGNFLGKKTDNVVENGANQEPSGDVKQLLNG